MMEGALPEDIQFSDPLPSAGHDMPLGGMASISGSTSVRPETGVRGDVAEPVRAAGERTVHDVANQVDITPW
jgi:hypothetical protein